MNIKILQFKELLIILLFFSFTINADEQVGLEKRLDLCYLASLSSMDMLRCYELTGDAEDTYRSFIVEKKTLPVFTEALKNSYAIIDKFNSTSIRQYAATTFYKCIHMHDKTIDYENVERCFVWPFIMSSLYNDSQTGVSKEKTFITHTQPNISEENKKMMEKLIDQSYALRSYDELIKETSLLFSACSGIAFEGKAE